MGILQDKTAIVTGGTRGIGEAIVNDLAASGADVAFTYTSEKSTELAEKIAENVRKMGRKALFIRIKKEESSFDQAQAVIDKVQEDWGKIDILVCNAGINWDGPIWKMKEKQWDHVLNTNLKGYFSYLRAASPIMREQRSGRIVMLTSINGMRGKFGQTNYAASKGGIIAMVKTAAKELGGRGITVNAVAPGLILTDMMDAMPEAAKQASLDETVLKRLGDPDDVAHVVTFFSSDLSRHVTGEVIKVDGGQYI